MDKWGRSIGHLVRCDGRERSLTQSRRTSLGGVDSQLFAVRVRCHDAWCLPLRLRSNRRKGHARIIRGIPNQGKHAHRMDTRIHRLHDNCLIELSLYLILLRARVAVRGTRRRVGRNGPISPMSSLWRTRRRIRSTRTAK